MLDLSLRLAPMGLSPYFEDIKEQKAITYYNGVAENEDAQGINLDLTLAPLGDHQAMILPLVPIDIDKNVEAEAVNMKPIDVAPLNMWPPVAVDGNPWIVKKQLTHSDVNGNLGRLLLSKDDVGQRLLPYFSSMELARIVGLGLSVRVKDDDTGDEFCMKLKKWPSGMHHLEGNWRRNFIARRRLEAGELVGLYWDAQESVMHFSVLSRR